MPDELPRPVITAAELRERLDDPRLRVADVRWYLGDEARGRLEYSERHIPGAIFVDLERDLSAPSGPGRHPLPQPIALSDRLGELGFGDGHDIVVYDQVGGAVASRMWWMLDRLGHSSVAVLDGGLRAWTRAGAEVTRMAPTPLRADLTLATTWSGTIDREAVRTDIHDIDLVDVRDEQRYRGEADPVDGVPGHIPGARNRPTATLLDEDGRLVPPETLRELLTAEGDRADRPMVLSCGSGVGACFAAMAARQAGLPEPLIYPGSFSDWARSGETVVGGDDPFGTATQDDP